MPFFKKNVLSSSDFRDIAKKVPSPLITAACLPRAFTAVARLLTVAFFFRFPSMAKVSEQYIVEERNNGLAKKPLCLTPRRKRKIRHLVEQELERFDR